MKSAFIRLFGGIKGLVFLLAVATGLTLYLFTQRIVNQLRNESRSLVQFYAQMYARVAETDSPEDIGFIFDQIIQRTHFPLIQTDDRKVPTGWKGISVHPDDRSEAGLKKVQNMVRRMDRQIEPVAVKYNGKVLAYLYYGDSRLIQELQWLPTIEILIVGLFLIVGFFGYANIKQSEQRHIWVGMAKETAHQLGTPISSLMGWLDVLRSGKRPELENIFGDIAKDLQRLKQVSHRFGQIGSKPDLTPAELVPVLKDTVEYIRRRAPHVGRKVLITESFSCKPVLQLNPGLFQWAVENVMKNALDAMDKDEGRIEVRLMQAEDSKRTVIEVEDNGRGIEGRHKNRVFKPGYSTKQRGWGLGLTLAKRIIEEYHRGRMFIQESAPGKGTVVRMEMW